jgi:sugar phosphate isomerase/epimerase
LSRNIGRRAFLAAAAGAIAGLKAGAALGQEQKTQKLDRIGLHLYTVRDMMKKSVPKTLAAVAKAGYKEVEFAGYFNTPVVEIRKILIDNGLTSPSTHVPMQEIGMMLPKTIEDAATLGQKFITVSWIDAPERTRDGYKRIADRFNAAGLRARGDNIQIGYHNYSYEFTPLAGGKSGFEILLSECDPLNLAMEADVFWMRKAKQDPLAWMSRFPNRFRMLHLKDMGPPPANQMRDVGKGVIDWKTLLAKSKAAGVQHFFVEHDEPKDPLASIRESYRYLKTLRIA